MQVDGSVQNLTMTYDEVGNVLSRYDSLISKTETFGYDTVNRLTSSQVTGQSAVSVAYSAAGRITSKTGLGSYSYGAGSAGPFAVTSANSVSYTYDANGRMVTRGSGEIDWYSYDLPSRIDDLSDSSYTEFWYGPDRSRIKQYQSASGATITYAGTLFEFEDASTDTYRHYVQAGDKVIAVVERVGTTNTRQYLHRDHQGSVVKVTDAAGSLLQSLAFDAWGLRRNASDWSALGSPFAGSHETERGYTGHEHLDTVGLIHMNGRVQDPILGRFISADPLIQAPYSTQSHNRYSYVWNNPASLIDPSGFCTEEDGYTGCSYGTVTVTERCQTAECRDAVRQRADMPQHVADSVARWTLRRQRADANLSLVEREHFANLNFLDYFRATTTGGYERQVISDLGNGMLLYTGAWERASRFDDPVAAYAGAVGDPYLIAAATMISLAEGAVSGVGIVGALRMSSVAARGTAGTISEGTRVYRVWGGASRASGRSWTRVNPQTLSNYREAAGLPSTNSGRYLSTGTLRDSTGVAVRRASPLDGNIGGLDEIVIPSVPRQVMLESVVPLSPGL